MNAEELTQLKKGDEIFIRARYKSVLGDGDVLFSHSVTNAYDEVVREDSYTHPSSVILPPSAPKYDPCRLFKKGDRVRIVETKGRKQECAGSLATVKKDEDGNKVLMTIDGSGIWIVDAAYLKLITPVEELEPWTLDEDDPLYWGIARAGGNPVMLPRDYFSKAAAEAECARLNAEYRKEEDND